MQIIDPMLALRMSFSRYDDDSKDRCGNCACWSWLPESNTEKHELVGRCLHPIRGPKLGLIGPKDGELCPNWQRDNPI